MGGYLRALKKKMVLWYCRTLLLGIFIAAVHVHGQSPTTEGFISIDCGATVNSTDSVTGIPYTTDDGFIETGVNYNISSNYLTSSLPKQYSTVRSFPDGNRNCYNLTVGRQEKRCLLRASFMYGNYDGKNSVQNNSPLLFDLYMNNYFWNTVKISDPSIPFTYEAIISVPVLVCLMRSNSSSTPFISSLELRPLKNTLYPGPDYNYCLILLARYNLGATAHTKIRYPDDPYDRIWEPLNITLNVLATTVEHNQTKGGYEVPSVVLQTASVSASVVDNIQFYWSFDSVIGHYMILHFSELEVLSEKDVREFDVYSDGLLSTANYTPAYLKQSSLSNTTQDYSLRHAFTVTASKRATRPPLLNAFEIYYNGTPGDSGTNGRDVEAMWKIKETYKLKKSWLGDPCCPIKYPWNGLNCREFKSEFISDLRITAIDLSSCGLVGQVSASFSNLTGLEFLDLSYNNLSGKLPDSLLLLTNLQVLNLTGNCITDVPKGLIEKSKDGSLILRYDNNTDICDGTKATPSSKSSTATSKKITTPIIIVLSVVPAIVLLVVVVFCVWRIRRNTRAINLEVVQPRSESLQFNVDHGGGSSAYMSHQSIVDQKDSQLPFKSRKFMYTELENITKNFSWILGRGGFGTVFHGSLEDGTEVAVKMCSLSSEQAPNLFLAEVENLSRVRHKNLVSLIGYCMDRGQMALIYEYMPLGSLEDHLRGKAGNGRALSWAERLQIVIDAAQGLDYLYNGCPMPIIHRDIKTSNMLLGQDLEGKISDFGLSKAFHSDFQTHVSVTTLAYTPGYVDPMCFRSGRFNEKTDVYSFGVVLLEIITGEPPIQHNRDVQIIERVQLSFEAGDINAIVDARMQGIYNVESVWMVSELAMRCTARAADQRPKMSEVLIKLRESLECEAVERSKSTTTESQGMPFMAESTIFSPSAR